MNGKSGAPVTEPVDLDVKLAHVTVKKGGVLEIPYSLVNARMLYVSGVFGITGANVQDLVMVEVESEQDSVMELDVKVLQLIQKDVMKPPAGVNGKLGAPVR